MCLSFSISPSSFFSFFSLPPIFLCVCVCMFVCLCLFLYITFFFTFSFLCFLLVFVSFFFILPFSLYTLFLNIPSFFILSFSLYLFVYLINGHSLSLCFIPFPTFSMSFSFTSSVSLFSSHFLYLSASQSVYLSPMFVDCIFSPSKIHWVLTLLLESFRASITPSMGVLLCTESKCVRERLRERERETPFSMVHYPPP